MYISGLEDTLVTHANMKGLGRTPSLGDRRGFMPPQLKTNKQIGQKLIVTFLVPKFETRKKGFKMCARSKIVKV